MNVIVIPDIHGRKFWRKAIPWADSMPIIFLGDYLDPYWDEGISPEEAHDELDAIIDFKRMYPKTVTLLLGNHDLHYLTDEGGCRFDWNTAYENKALLWAHLNLFDIAHAIELEGNRFLFTHAGVLRGWFEMHYSIKEAETATHIASLLNISLHGGISYPAALKALSEASPRRGGFDRFGSPVWADVTEQHPESYEFSGIYQVFGHTLMYHPKITNYWACLDCKEAFLLNLKSKSFKILYSSMLPL